MRLKKIKLAGFKSFVDPTTISLPSNLIGIVGPNGCGKSNVIDAVRWVMGESSAKHLRGDNLTDVIFTGSTSRKPVGQASVELVFDNSDGTLGGQYASYSEIAIRRELSRDAQSTYFLNGTRCRRRDITDIFLGTGLGPRSYAIIEQGMISRIIEAKPEELRVFLEEAAGISKYKERRRETENRIRHTRDNLDRLNDLREELEKRLQTLQRQAKAAEKYKELKHQERLLKAQLQGLRWRLLDGEIVSQEKQIQTLETALEGRIAELRRIEAQLEKLREQQVEENESFNMVQSQFYTVSAEITWLEQAIKHAKENREQQQRDLEEAQRSHEQMLAHLSSDQEKIAQLQDLLALNEAGLREAQQKEAESTEKLTAAERDLHAWQQAWDEFNVKAAAMTQAAEVARARIQHLEAHMTQSQERMERLKTELTHLAPQALEDEIQPLREQLAQWDHGLDDARNDVESYVNQIAEARRRHQQINESLSQARHQLQSVAGRYASLEALQEQALGKVKGEVTQWLSARGLSQATRLAEEIAVDTGWERAVETVLGFYLESVCVDGLEDIGQALGHLPHGRLSLFDASIPQGETRSHSSRPALLDKVSAPWQLDSLLSGIYIVDDAAQALAQRGTLAAHESLITRDGVWIGKNWLRVVRAQEDDDGVLVREQQLKQLEQQRSKLSHEIEASDDELKAITEQLHDLERTRDEKQAKLHEISQRRAEFQSQLSAKQARLEQTYVRSDRLKVEINEVKELIAKEDEELQSLRDKLTEALHYAEAHDQQRDDLLRQRDECRSGVDQWRQQLGHDREAVHVVALRVESMRTQLAATHAGLERIQTQVEQVARRVEELTTALAQGEEPIEAHKRKLDEALNKRIHVETQLNEARHKVEQVDHALRDFDQQRHSVESQAQEARNVLEQARMSCQEIRVRRQTLEEQLAESGFVLQDVLTAMPEGAEEPAWQAEVDRIAQQIQRLGAINLAAIDEFAEESQRKNYLDAQHADLTEALTTLENAIRKIDRETRDLFQETFDKVNAGLQSMFPRLFGGGQAYLEMTGESLLEAGVTVMARPPGKRISNIHLLSGGEKALSAVALVFSIFELNPAPFCMLDEVDAPLDDANVGRFAKLVEEMSQRVQFLYITHNKATMEMAHHLMGVTMHEPGVSRLVTVDIDDAVKMVATS